MRNILIATFTIILILSSCDNDPKSKEELRIEYQISEQSERYDKLKAEKLGADEYGMKKYIMAFLKKGPNRNIDSTKRVKLQKAHLENIENMAEEGKLVLAGPFIGEGEIRGIYIFNLQSLEEAEELTKTDPAIQAGSLEMELKEWYGSAALMELNDIHKTIQKKKVSED